MAYQTGSESSLSALVSAVLTFAVAEAGYVDEGTWVDGEWTVHALSRGGVYFLLRENGTRSRLNLADAISVGAPWGEQTGKSPEDSVCYPVTAPYTSYHLFATAGNVFAAVECGPGRYNHFMFGELVKVGIWSGGQFVAAGRYDDNHWNDGIFYYQNAYPLVGEDTDDGYETTSILKIAHANNNGYARFGENRYTSFSLVRAPTFHGPMGRYLTNRSNPNPFNQRAVMLQVQVYLLDESAGSQWRPLGYIEGIRGLRIDNLNPQQVINNNWMVFPLAQKGTNGANGVWPGSANYGVAYQQ
jgi:hypothetical protein